MAKILIVSDSHGLTNELVELKKKYKGITDLMIHCGDSELSVHDPVMDGFRAVRGNCDYDKQYPEELLDEVSGYRIYVTHGHLYSIKTSLSSLFYRAKELQASIVCFGHSHLLGAEMIGNTLFLNPGSIRLPRGRKERTYLLLTMNENQIEVQMFDYDQGEIDGLKQNFVLEQR